MTPKTTLQANTPRHASIRYRISAESWKDGFQNFFLHRVPFSGRSNADAAKKHVQLIRHIAQQIPQSIPILLLELGTGHGILSKNILDILCRETPELYQRTTITISDYSNKTLDFLKSSQFLQDHISHCIFKPEHTLFESENNDPFLYAYSSYLYDCFPCEMIRNTHEQNRQIQINTSLNPNIVLIDTSEETEKRIDMQQLKNFWDEDSDGFIKRFGAKIINHLNEEFIQSDTDIDSPRSNKEYTNYSHQIISHIQRVISLLKPGGAYVFSDIVQTADSTPLALSKSYNGILCAPITSDYIIKHFKLVDHKLFESTSDFLILNQTDPYAIRPIFNAIFYDIGTTEIEHFLASIRQKSISEQDIYNRFSSLSANNQSDYFLLKELCNHLLQNKQNLSDPLSASTTAALAFYSDQIINNFKELAADGWRIKVLLGITNRLPANEVSTYADNVLRLCPDDADLLRTIGMHCISQKNYQLAQEYLFRAWTKSSCVIPKDTGIPNDIIMIKQLLTLTQSHRIFST